MFNGSPLMFIHSLQYIHLETLFLFLMFLKQVSSPSLYLFNQKYIKEYIVKYYYNLK